MIMSFLTLPTEISSIIFRHSLSLATDPRPNAYADSTHANSDMTWLNGSFNIPDHTEVLMRLAAIGRVLQQAVHNDASLWTNIHCNMNFDLVLLYLQLSRQRPVLVHFFGTNVNTIPRTRFNRNRRTLPDAVKQSIISTATHIFNQVSQIEHMTFCFPAVPDIVDEVVFVFESIRPVFTRLKTCSFRRCSSKHELRKLKTLLANIPKSLVTLDLHEVTDNVLPLISGSLR